jgi:hypothetical protein
VYQVLEWAEVHRLFHREGWAKTRYTDEPWLKDPAERCVNEAETKQLIYWNAHNGS